jgi:hypothetical protein
MKRLLFDSLDKSLDDFEVLLFLILFLFSHYKNPGIINLNDFKEIFNK